MTAVVEKRNPGHQTALLTGTTLAYITHIFTGNEDENECDDPHAERAQDDSDGESGEDSYLALVADTDLAHIEKSRTEDALIHGTTVYTTKEARIESIHVDFGSERKDKSFDGIRVHTCSTKRSVMYRSQYSS